MDKDSDVLSGVSASRNQLSGEEGGREGEQGCNKV